MTREEFLGELERHLSCLQKDERDNAVAYYKEYLDEAGSEYEAEALMHLGSPESVAKRIIAEAGIPGGELPKPGSSMQYESLYRGEKIAVPEDKTPLHPGRVALTVAVMVVSFPLWITLFSIWLSFAVAQAVILAVFCFVGIAGPCQGIGQLIGGVASLGLYHIGCGLFCIGFLLLLSKPLDWLVKKSWQLLKKGFMCCVNGLLGKEAKA